MVHEHRDQKNDRNWNTDKPEQSTSAKTHDPLLIVRSDANTNSQSTTKFHQRNRESKSARRIADRDLHAAGEIARRLGMSKRTLARRVSSEGLTFAGILADLRVDLAKRHLTDEDLAISQIAWLLGYQEVSAFTHAFKRQTGKAPSEVRLKRAVS